MKHPWKARGTLSPHPPGAWAISCRPACCLHLRALSVGSPGGEVGKCHECPCQDVEKVPRQGCTGVRRGVWVCMGVTPPWGGGRGHTGSPGAPVLREHSAVTLGCHRGAAVPGVTRVTSAPLGSPTTSPKPAVGSRYREPRAARVAPPPCRWVQEGQTGKGESEDALGSLPWVLSPGRAPGRVPEQNTELCERRGSWTCTAGPAQLCSRGLCSPAQL